MISRWYQHFTYWIFIWYSLYLFDIISYNPFPAFILILLFDSVSLFMKQNTEKNAKFLPIHALRLSIVILLHYIPFLKLNYTIEHNSVILLLMLGFLYLFLFPNWYSYYFDTNNSTTINQFLTGRFFNSTIGILFVIFAVFIQGFKPKKLLKQQNNN